MLFRNAFLAAMDADDLSELSLFMKEVALFGGDTVSEPGQPIVSVYCPSSSAISTITIMSDGRHVETGSIGFEGVAGLLPSTTQIPPATRMVVQIGGGAISIDAEALTRRAHQSASLTALILRFAQASTAQAERSAACYALHRLPERLARWLLTCEDRVDRSRIMLTQDQMGTMAGALRSSVSLVASEFKEKGLIDYTRGHLEILDRAGLEAQACECYFHGRTRTEFFGHSGVDHAA
jgi:CRP-like cAMP-binding protein